MSKLYGKMWAEGNPGKISTRAGHNELTVQLLYGSRRDSRVAAEMTVTYKDGEFYLEIHTPLKIHLGSLE